MPTAKKLPSGSWRCRVYVGRSPEGKKLYRSFTAATRKQAEMDAALGAYESKQPEPELTLGQAIDRYIEAKSAILSPATVRGYRSLRKNTYASIIDRPLSAIAKEHQQIALNTYAASSKPKTVRNASGLLYSTMHMYCPDHAYALTLPQPKKQRVTIPTSAQLARLLDYVSGTWLLLVILLAASLGLRRSEISALRRDDFDMEGGTVHIQRAIVRADNNLWVIKSTKTTESDRILKVPSFILDQVKALPETGEYLISKKPDSISAAFRRVLKHLGLSFRFHDLRHYYASVLLALGVPDQYAMKRMGHSSTHMLKNVYQHIIDDKDIEVDAIIETKMEELF